MNRVASRSALVAGLVSLFLAGCTGDLEAGIDAVVCPPERADCRDALPSPPIPVPSPDGFRGPVDTGDGTLDVAVLDSAVHDGTSGDSSVAMDHETGPVVDGAAEAGLLDQLTADATGRGDLGSLDGSADQAVPRNDASERDSGFFDTEPPFDSRPTPDEAFDAAVEFDSRPDSEVTDTLANPDMPVSIEVDLAPPDAAQQDLDQGAADAATDASAGEVEEACRNYCAKLESCGLLEEDEREVVLCEIDCRAGLARRDPGLLEQLECTLMTECNLVPECLGIEASPRCSEMCGTSRDCGILSADEADRCNARCDVALADDRRAPSQRELLECAEEAPGCWELSRCLVGAAAAQGEVAGLCAAQCEQQVNCEQIAEGDSAQCNEECHGGDTGPNLFIRNICGRVTTCQNLRECLIFADGVDDAGCDPWCQELARCNLVGTEPFQLVLNQLICRATCTGLYARSEAGEREAAVACLGGLEPVIPDDDGAEIDAEPPVARCDGGQSAICILQPSEFCQGACTAVFEVCGNDLDSLPFSTPLECGFVCIQREDDPQLRAFVACLQQLQDCQACLGD